VAHFMLCFLPEWFAVGLISSAYAKPTPTERL
jgi:hypothetical protein